MFTPETFVLCSRFELFKAHANLWIYWTADTLEECLETNYFRPRQNLKNHDSPNVGDVIQCIVENKWLAYLVVVGKTEAPYHITVSRTYIKDVNSGVHNHLAYRDAADAHPITAITGLLERLQGLEGRGRFLSDWDAETGLPTTNPAENPYPYKAGDYYIVSNISETTNYRPDGEEYIHDVPSMTVETSDVAVNDTYMYDGTVWILRKDSEPKIPIDVALSLTSENPVQNKVITAALNTKQNILTAGANISIVGTTISCTYEYDLTKQKVITALGYTPYDSTNPDGFITGITSSDIIDALGYTPYSTANPAGYITSYTVTQTDVTTALGYTPISPTQLETQLESKQDITDNTLTTTDKTIVGAINELDARPSAPAIDNKTITKNASDQLQTVAVIDQNNTSNGIKTWTGTKAQYNALASKDSNTLYNITDEYGGGALSIAQESGNSQSDVMSQKATTEYPALQKRYSSSNLFKSQVVHNITSLRRYKASEVRILSYVQRGVMVGGRMFYRSSDLFNLWKDNNNYFRFFGGGYDIRLEMKKNGVSTTETLMSFSSSESEVINQSLSLYFEMDLYRKTVKIVNYTEHNSTFNTILEHDISDYDLSFLDEFNIKTTVNGYQYGIAYEHFRINSIYDYKTLLTEPMVYANYNRVPTNLVPRQDLSYPSTGVRVGGTLTLNEPNHKISNVSQASHGYFALGVKDNGSYNPAYVCEMFRFKVTSGTMQLSQGAAVQYGCVLDADTSEIVYTLSSTKFTPTLNKEYIVFVSSTNSLAYAGQYSFYASGTFTVEIWDGDAFEESWANFCAETYNGTYFMGNIPCLGEGVLFEDKYMTAPNYTTYQPKNMIIAYSNNIYMFDGISWKRINNA